MNKIPCEIIQDLLPLYVDGLTNKVTDKEIEEHVDGCEKCRHTLESMRAGGDTEYVPDESEKKEIDFLKKNKKRNLRIILASLGAAALIIAAVIFIRVYMVGNIIYGDWVICNVKVDGNQLDINGEPVDDVHAISNVEITEEDGVITIRTNAVMRSFFHKGGFKEIYTAKSDIRTVKVNDRILWDDGREISQLTSAVFETRHDYVGDMPANGNTARSLNMQNRLGDYTVELETDKEPYGWKFYLNDDISSDARELKEYEMESMSYILIGVIGNLDRVTFEYTVDGKAEVKTVDSAMANEFFGQDIKGCGKSARLLEELIELTRLK